MPRAPSPGDPESQLRAFVEKFTPAQQTLIADPHGLLLGSGKQRRFLRLESADALDRPEVEDLLAVAVARARAPFDAAIRRTLVIRSVSAKQRPRRSGSA